MKKHIPPIPIKAGDPKVKIQGDPPLVDCRVIAEEEYQFIMDGFNKYQQIKNLLK